MTPSRARAAVIAAFAIAAITACGGRDDRSAGAPSSGTEVAGSGTESTVLEGSTEAADESPPPVVTYAGQVTTTSTTSTTSPAVSITSGEVASPERPVALPTDALFASGRCDIEALQRSSVIDGVRPLIESLGQGGRLIADGWTDDRGEVGANLRLSSCRAQTVVEIIETEWPDMRGRIDVVGHGESSPPVTCSGDCPQNRVVVISLAEAAA